MVAPGYERLVERLNRFPQGAPPAEPLYRILEVLFSEEEAAQVAQLPIKAFTAAQAARIWRMELAEARAILEKLSGRAILFDAEVNGETRYTLPPPMAGFFEFSMMRLREDVDQQLLAELYYQYCTVEEDFMHNLLANGETQMGRIFIHEPVLPPEVQVLDYERASEVIRTATHRGISQCYCRVKAARVHGTCTAPQDICMTFGGVADWLARRDFARRVDVAEGLDLLQQAYEHNLVQFGENTRQGVAFICNCCSCCCEALIAGRRFGFARPIHTSNYLPVVNRDACTGCGRCVTVCPVEALGLVAAHDPAAPKRKVVKLDAEACLGCGVCVRNCAAGALAMTPRAERVITPLNSAHRIVSMAIERGTLQDLLFDDRTLWSHRTLATLLGALLKLSPVQRVLASQQVKSRYLETLLRGF